MIRTRMKPGARIMTSIGTEIDAITTPTTIPTAATAMLTMTSAGAMTAITAIGATGVTAIGQITAAAIVRRLAIVTTIMAGVIALCAAMT